MRRRYQRALYEEKVNAIKKFMPHCCIGADVMVGFPGETHADFLETYEFLNTLDVSYLHVFTYSERNHTLAASMPGSVPSKERRERSAMLHILSEKKKRAFYQDQLGRTVNVLFENDLEHGLMHGFTENYVRVATRYDPLLINTVKSMRLTSLNEKGLAEAEEIETLLFTK